ncbi:MAG: hypothetical protein CM1200mP20_15170 [Pseudomonadota bacterium]|nr:MAG: hypothetical protein CM1200mP20_15170 [Pseudomonadota bacterium]
MPWVFLAQFSQRLVALFDDFGASLHGFQSRLDEVTDFRSRLGRAMGNFSALRWPPRQSLCRVHRPFAASTEALSASRLVWKAMSLISVIIPEIRFKLSRMFAMASTTCLFVACALPKVLSLFPIAWSTAVSSELRPVWTVPRVPLTSCVACRASSALFCTMRGHLFH